MKTIRTITLLLLIFLLCGCGNKAVTADAAHTGVPAVMEAAAAPERATLLSFTEDEGPEKGAELTCWSYAGNEAAEFLTILLPMQEEFPLMIGTMYEGKDAALLTGVVRGDSEGGTAELILADEDGAETVLMLMYSRDKVALLELDAEMLSFCRQDAATGLWMVVFTDDGPMSFSNAAMLLEGLTEKYSLEPAFQYYGLDPARLMDLRIPQQ